MIQFSVLNGFRPCFISRDIVTHNLTDACNISPAAPQISGSLEGTDTGFGKKIIGIYDNSGIYTVSFNPCQLHAFIKILKDLGHHFTGRGSIWFRVGKGGIAYNLTALAVVIQNHNVFGTIQKFRIFGITWTVGIYDNQYSIIIHQFICHMVIDKHVRFIVPVFQEHIQIRCNGMTVAVNQDICFFTHASGCPENTNGSTECIDIGNLMSHNDNIIFGIDNLQKSLSFDTGPDTGALFHLLGFTAIVGNGVSVFYHGLIPATSQGEVDSCMGKRIVFLIILTISTDADT